MLIKSADDKTNDLRILGRLKRRSDASPETRQRIEQEIRNIRSGMKGEDDVAHEMAFYYGESPDWTIIHDLRLECEGRVAQIDHILIHRSLEIYVCESKRFSGGVAINDHGEFTTLYQNKPDIGIPSPIEQNVRHMAVLKAIFKTGQVPLPKLRGVEVQPSLNSFILVSAKARIDRPQAYVEGMDRVIKYDQLRSRIDADLKTAEVSPAAANLVDPEPFEVFARRLAAAHKPFEYNWPAKFGLAGEAAPIGLQPMWPDGPAHRRTVK